ncbi:MAG: hypothetical protein ACREQM_05305, partial [Candidatus Dormibacteraceae bacterium]
MTELSDEPAREDARPLKQLVEALTSERARQQVLEERRSRELKQTFERATIAAEERAATLAFAVEDLQAHLR